VIGHVKERVWTGDVRMEYPQKWIVMVNLGWDPTTTASKMLGEVYAVMDSRDEAFEMLMNLGDSLGKTMVVTGHDPRPQIGGLYRCVQ
jgi:hypothetical protein